MQLRGPNFGLQDDGTILLNALQIFDVDGLDEEAKEKAIEQGKVEAENVVKYLKEKLLSFKNGPFYIQSMNSLFRKNISQFNSSDQIIYPLYPPFTD